MNRIKVLWREHPDIVWSEAAPGGMNQGKSHLELFMFADTHPADSLLLAQHWLRALTMMDSSQISDPELLFNRKSGVPEHVVIDLSTFRTIQSIALKGLMKDLAFRTRPEEILTLLQKPVPKEDPSRSTIHVQSAPVSSVAPKAGTLSISGLRLHIDTYPAVIGTDDSECSHTIPADLLPQLLLPVHCVIDRLSSSSFALEAFGTVTVDGKRIEKNSVCSISPGSLIAFPGGLMLGFFPQ